MKERPILFSGPMVKAILEGRKTQTRRVLKPQPLPWAEAVEVAPYNGYGKPGSLIQRTFDDRLQCGLCGPKFGKVGDRLWVRETWHPHPSCRGSASYRATWPDDEPPDEGWKSSIHMPRWASRITLEITGIRVERLQEITQEDAVKEGCYNRGGTWGRLGFSQLWDSINSKRGFGWETNPWVWVVEFKMVSQQQSERK